MTTLTPEEEVQLRPVYEKYLAAYLEDRKLSFVQWWRAMADEAKEKGEI
jgi:hypothetical protein